MVIFRVKSEKEIRITGRTPVLYKNAGVFFVLFGNFFKEIVEWLEKFSDIFYHIDIYSVKKGQRLCRKRKTRR